TTESSKVVAGPRTIGPQEIEIAAPAGGFAAGQSAARTVRSSERRPAASGHSLAGFAVRGVQLLQEQDRTLYELLEREYRRQTMTLAMVAASSVAGPSVLACEAAVATNVTTEGYPGARFHGGCQVVDQIERLAIERAKSAFGARFANVQP